MNSDPEPMSMRPTGSGSQPSGMQAAPRPKLTSPVPVPGPTNPPGMIVTPQKAVPTASGCNFVEE